MRVAVVVLGVEPDQLEQLLHRLLDGRPRASRPGSGTARRRSCRRCAAGSARSTGPGRSSGCRGAAAASSPSDRWRDVAALEDDRAGGRLEQPGDQPRRWCSCRSRTRPRSRRSRRVRTSKSTPSTACTAPTVRCSSPALIGKCLSRPATDEQVLAPRSQGARGRELAAVPLASSRWRWRGSGVASCQPRLDLVDPDLLSLGGREVAGDEVAAVPASSRSGTVAAAGRADPRRGSRSGGGTRSPGGTWIRLGGVPLIGISRSVGGRSKRGIEPSSPQV